MSERKSLLVEGCIPAGKPCPFLEQCGMKDNRCPTEELPRKVDYSCAVARGWDLIETS